MGLSETSYREWHNALAAREQTTNVRRWRSNDSSHHYDYRVIRRRHDELAEIVDSGDVDRLLYYFNEGLHGNMGGMGSPRLYRTGAAGTKHLVSDYIRGLAGALDTLADAPDAELPRREKLAFFRRARHAFGSSALMLSGAGSLGPFHVGVARALREQHLLPAVISGASAGGIIASVLCTRDDAQLDRELHRDDLSASALTVADNTERERSIDRETLRGIVETAIPDLTFAEALEESGRHLNISVAPSEFNQQSRTLNAVISPNVYIGEAVMASCAIPGVFPAVTLMARGARGERVPYVRSRKWVDGSVTDDMPTRRLARVYGCNFFIASQTNPVVLWALQDPNAQHPVSQYVGLVQSVTRQLFRAAYPLTMQWLGAVYPLNVMTRLVFGILTQEYTANVNIMPKSRFRDPTRLLTPMTHEETARLIRDGERSTWPHVERIRNSMLIGQTLHACLARLGADRDSPIPGRV